MYAILSLIDVLSLLVILLTASGFLLEANGRSARCTMIWVSFLLLGIGAGYGLTQAGSASPWEICLHVGVAMRCVQRSPGPWWGWITRGTKHPDRRRAHQ